MRPVAAYPGPMTVVDRLREVAPEVLRGTPVTVAYLFGSYARDEARSDSDVDIAVLLDRSEADPEHDLDLTDRLAERLERSVGARVDPFLVLDAAPLRLVGRVLRDRVVLYSRDETHRVSFETRMGPQALDYELKAAALDRRLLLDFASGRR